MQKREVPIFPDAPALVRENEVVRAVVTALAFGESAILTQPLPDRVDMVFCFGSNEGHKRQGQSLSALFNSKVQVGHLLMTSGMDWKLYPDVRDLGQSIAMATYRAIGNVPDETMVGIEAVSTNTKDNAVMGWAAMTNSDPENIVISALTFHMGRCHRTLMAEAARHGWNGSILYYPYRAQEMEKDGSFADVNPHSWHTSDVASSRVWGEAQRIYKYGARGDVMFLPDDKSRFKLLKDAGLVLGA